jgi:hypothetical protein
MAGSAASNFGIHLPATSCKVVIFFFRASLKLLLHDDILHFTKRSFQNYFLGLQSIEETKLFVFKENLVLILNPSGGDLEKEREMGAWSRNPRSGEGELQSFASHGKQSFSQ